MLLKSAQDYRKLIGAGQLTMVAGLLCSRMAGAGLMARALEGVSAGEWIKGFAQGLSVPLFAASIWLNVRGILLSRSAREGRRACQPPAP